MALRHSKKVKTENYCLANMFLGLRNVAFPEGKSYSIEKPMYCL